MTCSAPTAAHDGRDVRRMVAILDRTATIHYLCQGCRDRLSSMGLDLFEDRRDPDSRRPFARWGARRRTEERAA